MKTPIGYSIHTFSKKEFMILGVLKATKINERRVALSPEVVKLHVKKEFRVQVESGA